MAVSHFDPLLSGKPDLHPLPDGAYDPVHLPDTLLTLPEIKKQEVEVVRSQVNGLFPVPHFDTGVTGKSLDGDEMLLLEGEGTGASCGDIP